MGLGATIFEKATPGGQARAANLIEDYPGFPDSISGSALMSLFLQQTSHHNIKIRNEAVTCVKQLSGMFESTTDRGKILSRTLIVASGLIPKRLKIPGEEGLYSRRVFAYADPYDVPHNGKSILIIGGGDAAFDQAINFAREAQSVTIAMKGNKPKCVPHLVEMARGAGVEILHSCIAKAISECRDQICVTLARGGEIVDIEVDIMIVCIGKERHFDFLPPELVCSPVPGLFFAGDCRHEKERHVAIAVGDGTTAAIEAARYLWK